MAIIKGNRTKVGAQVGVTRHRARGVAEEDITFTAGQNGEAFLRSRGANFKGSGIAKDGSGDRFTEIDIKAGEGALLIDKAKTGQVGIADTNHTATLLHDLQSSLTGLLRRRSFGGGRLFRSRCSRLFGGRRGSWFGGNRRWGGAKTGRHDHAKHHGKHQANIVDPWSSLHLYNSP